MSKKGGLYVRAVCLGKKGGVGAVAVALGKKGSPCVETVGVGMLTVLDKMGGAGVFDAIVQAEL